MSDGVLSLRVFTSMEPTSPTRIRDPASRPPSCAAGCVRIPGRCRAHIVYVGSTSLSSHGVSGPAASALSSGHRIRDWGKLSRVRSVLRCRAGDGGRQYGGSSGIPGWRQAGMAPIHGVEITARDAEGTSRTGAGLSARALGPSQEGRRLWETRTHLFSRCSCAAMMRASSSAVLHASNSYTPA